MVHVGTSLARTREPSPRVLLIACGHSPQLERSLEELAELVRAAGGTPVGTLVQHLDRPDSALYLGRGKAEELRDAAVLHRVQLVVADDELTLVQRRNLEQLVGVPVLDRTHIILDIFARRARSREGKLQVELAQLTYLLPRLAGWGQVLSRLGGGIGTRGPGETKLEVDRRRIKARIAQLRRELEQVRRHREQQRRGRESLGLALVALVGYTNSGKSTLLNALSGSSVSARDRLFETLDPTVRRVHLVEGMDCLMSDTVGFIRKLPAHLVAAFRATLEEVTRAALLVHVVDASADDAEARMAAVFETLEEIGAAGRPMVLAFNKVDRADAATLRRLLARYPEAVPISALHGTHLDELRRAIARRLPEVTLPVELEVPYEAVGLLAQLYRRGRVMEQQYLPHAIRIRVAAPEAVIMRLVRAGAEGKGARTGRGGPGAGHGLARAGPEAELGSVEVPVP